MKRLYEIIDVESIDNPPIYAAESPEQAATAYLKDDNDNTDPDTIKVVELDLDALIAFKDGETGAMVRKTARELLEEVTAPLPVMVLCDGHYV